jgi:hypothetical protein
VLPTQLGGASWCLGGRGGGGILSRPASHTGRWKRLQPNALAGQRHGLLVVVVGHTGPQCCPAQCSLWVRVKLSVACGQLCLSVELCEGGSGWRGRDC